MTYLLDSTAISDLIGEDPSTSTRASSIREGDRVVTCTVVRGEILFGLRRMPPGTRASELKRKADAVFSHVPCESLPPEVGDQYADLKLSQQKVGFSLDENDLWIAATAMIMSAVLVSRDSDFRRINGLAIEDWSV